MFKLSRIPTTLLLLILISTTIYTISQATYYNETRRTENGREGTVYDYTIADEGGATA